MRQRRRRIPPLSRQQISGIYHVQVVVLGVLGLLRGRLTHHTIKIMKRHAPVMAVTPRIQGMLTLMLHRSVHGRRLSGVGSLWGGVGRARSNQ